MKYTLMHKEIMVAELELDESTGVIAKVSKIYEEAHLPVGTVVRGGIDRKMLNEWWDDRTMPKDRVGYGAFHGSDAGGGLSDCQ